MSIIISTLYYYYTITISLSVRRPRRSPPLLIAAHVPLAIGLRRNCSLLKVQRIILCSGAALDYYLNSLFRFKTEVYAARNGRLAEIDRDVFYDMSKVCLMLHT